VCSVRLQIKGEGFALTRDGDIGDAKIEQVEGEEEEEDDDDMEEVS
jgi:hypothetical protein